MKYIVPCQPKFLSSRAILEIYIDFDPENKFGGQICMPIELPVDLSLEEKAL